MSTLNDDNELREQLIRSAQGHGIARATCSTAHPGTDVYHPDGHKNVTVTFNLDQLVRFIHQRDEARDRQHTEIYAWLLGLCGDFPQSEPGKRYGWRSVLRDKLPKDILYKINKDSSNE